jgi:hypothetical protein
MSGVIYLELEGKAQELPATIFLHAGRDFLSLLQIVDAALSHEPRGTMYWTIEILRKQSPALIGLLGKPRQRQRAVEDTAHQVHMACIQGLRILEQQAELPAMFTDETLPLIRRLAHGYHDQLERCTVISDNERVQITTQTLAHIDVLSKPTFEAYSSVAGRLESVSLHRAQEFRVWEEGTGRPVVCQFSQSQFEDVRKALGKRVLVHGVLRSNALGHPIIIRVEGIEIYPSEEELPTIEEISGFVPDLTEGKSLAEYMQDLSNG